MNNSLKYPFWNCLFTKCAIKQNIFSPFACFHTHNVWVFFKISNHAFKLLKLEFYCCNVVLEACTNTFLINPESCRFPSCKTFHALPPLFLQKWQNKNDTFKRAAFWYVLLFLEVNIDRGTWHNHCSNIFELKSSLEGNSIFSLFFDFRKLWIVNFKFYLLLHSFMVVQIKG